MSDEPTDWSKTSFKDEQECAVHYMMVDFFIDVTDRQTQLGNTCDLSDIYQYYRRSIRVVLEDPTKAHEYVEYQRYPDGSIRS